MTTSCNACDAIAPEAADNDAGYCDACSRVWYSGNYLELSFEREDAADIARSGANDKAVEYARTGPYMRAQLAAITDEKLWSEMRETFFEEGDADCDRATAESRVIWCAAWNIHDLPEED